MKEQFDTPSEYSSTMNSVLFYEIWSKISESYHMVLSGNPNLEQSIFEKSSKKYVYYFSIYILSTFYYDLI